MSQPTDEFLPPSGASSDDTLAGLLDGSEHGGAPQADKSTRPDPTRGRLPQSGVTPPVPRSGPDGASRYVASSEGQIGRGGMGRVEVVRDRVLGRPVARKVLEPADGRVSATLMTRFLREARVTARLEHPGIVPVHDLVRLDDGRLAYTMKRVRGQTLGEALAASVGLAARMLLLGHIEDVCNALAFAHSEGVVHRDLKPANVLIGAFGETVVIDWGLARVEGEEDPLPDEAEAEGEGSVPGAGLTRVGHVIGTPRYMSPEQARADHARVDARTDVWALGMMLRELLTGERPHGEGDADTLLGQARRGRLLPTADVAPGADRPLCAIADKATAHHPEDRYRDASEMAADVAAWRAGAPVAAYRYGLSDQVIRLVSHNRRTAGVGALAVLTLLALSAAYAVRLGAARDAALAEEQQAVRSEQAAQVGMLRATARRAETLGHHDRGLALLWAAHEVDKGAHDDLTAELARAVAQAWPQRLVHAGDQPVLGLHPAPGDSEVVAVLRDGTVLVGGADGLGPSSARVAPDSGVLVTDSSGLLGASEAGGGVSAWRRDAAGASVGQWSVPGDHEAYVLAAAPGGGAVVGGAGGALLLLSPGGDVAVVDPDRRLAQVEALAVAPRAGRIFSAAMLDDAVRSWSWPGGEAGPVVALDSSAVHIAVAEASDRLLSLTPDGKVHAHTLDGDRAWSVLVGGGGGRIVVAPDGRHAAVLTRRAEVVMLSLEAGEVQWRRGGLSRREGGVPVFDRSGTLLAVPGRSNGVAVLGARTGDVQARLGGGSRDLTELVFTGDGALWGASEDGTVRRWTPPAGQAGWAWSGSGARITAVAARPEASQLLVGDAAGGLTQLDTRSGRGAALASLGRPVCAVQPVAEGWAAVVSEACAGLAATTRASADAGWQVYVAGPDGAAVARARGAAGGAVIAAFDGPDALVLADGCVDRVGETGASRVGCLGEAPGWRPRALASAPDGGVVVSGVGGGAGLVGLGPSGEMRFKASPRIATPSPDGARWAVTTATGLGLLDSETGRVEPLLQLDSLAQALAWSEDGAHLGWSEEALGVGVIAANGGGLRRLIADTGAVDFLGLSAGAAWVAGQDEHGHLFAWTTGLAEPVVEHPGEFGDSPIPPVFVGETVVRFHGGSASAPPLPSGVSAAALAEASAARTPWRACLEDGTLALLPGQTRASASAACLPR